MTTRVVDEDKDIEWELLLDPQTIQALTGMREEDLDKEIPFSERPRPSPDPVVKKVQAKARTRAPRVRPARGPVVKRFSEQELLEKERQLYALRPFVSLTVADLTACNALTKEERRLPMLNHPFRRGAGSPMNPLIKAILTHPVMCVSGYTASRVAFNNQHFVGMWACNSNAVPKLAMFKWEDASRQRIEDWLNGENLAVNRLFFMSGKEAEPVVPDTFVEKVRAKMLPK